ncbi:MAG: PH domain-containing protein [Patescibacteria group bacterium]|jgi:hypothetical protein
MNKKRKLFPNQRDDEEVFLYIRKHWFVYLPFFFFAAGVAASILIALFLVQGYASDISSMTQSFLIVFITCYILLMFAVLLYGFIDFYLDVDIVTNHRIIDIEQNGFFRRRVSELTLGQIEDVSAHVDGFFPTTIHFGDLHIQTAGNKENFLFKSVAQPYKLAQLILDLQEAQKTKSEKILERCRQTVRNSSGLSKFYEHMEEPPPRVHDYVDHSANVQPLLHHTGKKHPDTKAGDAGDHVAEYFGGSGLKGSDSGSDKLSGEMKEGEIIDF